MKRGYLHFHIFIINVKKNALINKDKTKTKITNWNQNGINP